MEKLKAMPKIWKLKVGNKKFKFLKISKNNVTLIPVKASELLSPVNIEV